MRVVCCGQPFTNSGLTEEGNRASRLWFRELTGRAVAVVLSSSCAVHLRHWQRHAAAETERSVHIFEFCEYLERSHPERRGGRLSREVCLHSSCHGLRDSHVDRDARAALSRIEGLTVREAERAEECCGFGGSFSVSFPELSVRMGQDRNREIAATGVQEVVATDLSCLLHLEGIARQQGTALRYRHISELIGEALE